MGWGHNGLAIRPAAAQVSGDAVEGAMDLSEIKIGPALQNPPILQAVPPLRKDVLISNLILYVLGLDVLVVLQQE